MSTVYKTATGVFHSRETLVCLGAEELALLREEACNAPLRRARICAHTQGSDSLHEMVIALCEDSYILPHKHMGKSESFHAIAGEALVCLFDEHGNVLRVIRMGQNHCIFYRLSEPLYHTVLAQSPVFIFHETTNGPFDAAQTHNAPFAPVGSDAVHIRSYMNTLRSLCTERLLTS